jgi:hypothetical protein
LVRRIDMLRNGIWDCKIGVRGSLNLPNGCDLPMRKAVEKAFREITGQDAEFIFSGWDGKLTDSELKVVEEEGTGTHGVYVSGSFGVKS